MFETKDTKLCRGCLSLDRKLTSVSGGDLNLYYSLLAEDRKLDALSIPGLDLCWECVAMLRRIQIFQAQVQQAHTVLEDSLGLPTGKATLSSLTIQQKLEYDDIFEETEPNDQPLFCKTKVPHITVDKIVIPTKYKALVTKNANIIKGKINDDLTKIDYDNDETGNMSDDSDDYEKVGACDRRSSSPELTIKKNIPRKKLQDVKIVKHSSLNDEKSKGRAELHDDLTKIDYDNDETGNMSDDSDNHENVDACDRRSSSPEITIIKIVKHSELNDEKPKSRNELQAKRVIMNRPVKNMKYAPIVKTPVIAKLELELQKLMQNAKDRAKNVSAQQSKSKQKKTIKESTTSNEQNDIEETKKNDRDHDDSESSAEDDDSNNDRKERKNIYKRKKLDEDPDFRVKDDDGSDSDYGKPKEDGPKENLDDGDKKKIIKKNRFKKTTIARYKHIDEVLSCFTEIEMSVDDLKSYLEKQDAIVDEKKPYGCNICGQRFKRNRTLTGHAMNHHKATHRAQFRKGNFYNPPPAMPERPRLWRCGVCATMLRRRHALAHMNAHHRTQYSCNAQGCEWSTKGFWTKEDYVEHWTAIHRQFVCDICGKRKMKKSALELHIMKSHFRLPKQQCPHCRRAYVHRKALVRHVQRRHAAPEPAERRYCVECDVTFPTVVSLQKHFYYKHNKAKKRYPCAECGRVLATSYSYRNHYSLFHTGRTDHCCHVCGKYFSKSQALDGHLKTHLNIKIPKTKPCSICGRKFQTNRALRLHTHTHTGERPYACAQCGAAYTQPHCLRVHAARRHAPHAPAPAAPASGTAATPATTQGEN